MRIQHVVARAFGPLRDATLDLAPGLTVVAGPNEAGKSSWHAAIRLALTGVRRGRGRTTAADAAVEQRHRPWDVPERWEVEARIVLEDGRTIDLQQDLAGKVACRAVDVALGRDVSDEILDGTPDASLWLGLDRESFAATVSVNQAQISAVANAETASLLQEHMQRAAATRGTDATAAEAIERLVAFRRDAVGFDRVGAKGPLRAARLRVEQAEAELADARRQHGEYLERAAGVEEAARREVHARGSLAAAEAALAHARAADAQARRAEADELASRHPVPPPVAAVRDEVADVVAAALDGWRRRPSVVALSGRSATELESELARLPSEPVGDVEAHPTVAAAAREVDLADAAMQALGEPPPAQRPSPVDEQELRRLAAALRVPQPEHAAGLEAELAAALAQPAVPGVARPSGALLLAGALFLAGLGALVAIETALLAVSLLAAGLVLAAWAVRRGARDSQGSRRIAELEAALRPYRDAAAHARDERDAAVREARMAGLRPDPDALDSLADQAAMARLDAQRSADWSTRHGAAVARQAAALGSLADALCKRGSDPGKDPRQELQAYLAACAERARATHAAAAGASLRRELEARMALERSAAGARHSAAAAEQALRQAASRAGLVADTGEPDRIVAELEAWRRDRAAKAKEAERAIGEWQRLTSLLDGRSLEELRLEADRRAAEADRRLADAEGEPLPSGPVDEDLLAALRREVSRAERELAERSGALDVMGTDLPSVAEAEEACGAAADELRRVEGLAAVLDETLHLLRAAEERVHRDLAPILAASVERWLPMVSGGSYVQASVDPADLAIRVKEARTGRWREARLLSEGTREQIYLLLRIAMAEHLVRPGEVAPLLLDEVTAQSDPERRDQLLRVLHELSGHHQIVVFTHDDAVVAWAEHHLVEPRDRIVRLAAATALPSSEPGTVASLPIG